MSAEEALATAVRTFNQRDLVRGYSPVQHVLGQAPDETGRIDVSRPHIPPELLVENPSTEFQEAVRRRAEAEKAHSEWVARQRLVRAANSRSKRVHGTCKDFGDRNQKESGWFPSARILGLVRAWTTTGEVLRGTA